MEKRTDKEIQPELHNGLLKASEAIIKYFDNVLPPEDLNIHAIEAFLMRIKAEHLKYGSYDRKRPLLKCSTHLIRYKNGERNRDRLIDSMYYIYRETINLKSGSNGAFYVIGNQRYRCSQCKHVGEPEVISIGNNMFKQCVQCRHKSLHSSTMPGIGTTPPTTVTYTYGNMDIVDF